jgi:hypothetical protein
MGEKGAKLKPGKWGGLLKDCLRNGDTLEDLAESGETVADCLRNGDYIPENGVRRG